MADFCLIAKPPKRDTWRVVKNPVWRSPSSEFFARRVLELNEFVDYVEYRCCGVVYRVVIAATLKEYGLEEN